MNYDDWLNELRNIIELQTGIPRDQHQAVFNITDTAWQKMFDDKLSPQEAFDAEEYAYRLLI
jgi:hypothetical protein